MENLVKFAFEASQEIADQEVKISHLKSDLKCCMEVYRKLNKSINESMLKTESLWNGFQDNSFVDYYQEWVDWYWKQDSSKKIKLQLLTNQSPTEKQLKKISYPNREVKFYKKSHTFSATTWIAGEYMIILETKQRPHYAIEIRNSVLTNNQREIFKALWNYVK